MLLVQLNVELLHLVCEELSLPDIFSLRQTCRFLCDATRSKSLWVHRMEALQTRGSNIPPYIHDYHLLESSVLEALVRRLTKVADHQLHRDDAPSRYCSLGLPQPITWLRLVDGRWLFVAFSNRESSQLACWDISGLNAGYGTPVAEAFLPGRVNSAQVEIQCEGIVLALGIEGEQPSTLVTTLQRQEHQFAFYELANLKTSSYVLMLSGSLLGCAIQNQDNTPHLLDWKNGHSYEIAAPPGGHDVPDRRSVPHLMAMHNDVLVIVRCAGIEVYNFSADSIVFLHHIHAHPIWEAVLVPSPVLHLLLLTRTGLESVIFDSNVNDQASVPSITCLAQTPPCRCASAFDGPPCQSIYHSVPWYCLSAGTSGHKCMWISVAGGDGQSTVDPYLMSMDIPQYGTLRPLGISQPISWSLGPPDSPALWGLPSLDFDDTLGTVVMGNCFGELAFYDYDKYLDRCLWLSPDPSWISDEPLRQMLEQSPVVLDTPPYLTKGISADEIRRRTSHWSQELRTSSANARMDWSECRAVYWWQGLPCDYAWVFQHAYGFPGRVLPETYFENHDGGCNVSFRIGNRRFIFVDTRNDDAHFRSWPTFRSREPGSDDEDSDEEEDPWVFAFSEQQFTTRGTVITARGAYLQAYARERGREFEEPGRDRGQELKERGGYKDWPDMAWLSRCPLLLFE
ncbi:F-box domain-containing protein [Mycena chlorophos]|uniref:F-box domain-containing protein n=1 Tax=Mycena chlorophos TaxID=658473 RepID=A0A8H6VT10_MYCCL|nr:F-box domain-containing protein [Mycena chlorophos]